MSKLKLNTIAFFGIEVHILLNALTHIGFSGQNTGSSNLIIGLYMIQSNIEISILIQFLLHAKLKGIRGFRLQIRIRNIPVFAVFGISIHLIHSRRIEGMTVRNKIVSLVISLIIKSNLRTKLDMSFGRRSCI